MGDTSLIFSIIARDKTTGVIKKIQAQASSSGAIAARALGPAIAPVLGVGTAAVIGLGGALAGAGVAAGVFGAVATTAMKEVTENATKFEDLADKIELYGRQASIMAARGEDNSKMLKKQADAALELEARLSLLPPETRKATVAFMGMKDGWKAFVETNKPATFSTLASGYGLIGKVVNKLQPFFDIGRAAADRLLASLHKMADGGGIGKMAAIAGPAMASLTSIIINISRALGGMMGKFSGEGNNMLDWIEEATRKWAAWAQSTEQGTGINAFVDYVRTNGPAVVALLSSLAAAAVTISQGMAPLAPISLAVAGALAAIIAAVPPNVITTLVAGYIAFGIALKAYAVYQGLATAAQWLFNIAMLANPVTWIVLGILALVAVIVLIATKTTWFQSIWAAVWGFMKGVGAWFAGPFANFFVSAWGKITASWSRARNQAMTIINFLKNLFLGWVNVNLQVANKIIGAWNKMVSFFRNAPGRIKGALSGMFNGLWSGFRNVVNRIIGGWNRLSFSIPGFSFAGMTVGGFSVGTPNIPYLARGAGSVQAEGLAYIHRGERVTPAARVTPYRSSSGEGGAAVVFKSDGTRVGNLVLELVREAIRDRGGDVVKVLAPR